MLYARAKGQSTLEYVILIGFVVAALIAMGVYMKRGAEGKLRESSDQIGEQYEAGRTTGTFRVTSNMDQHERVNSAGQIFTQIDTNTQTRNGSETVVGLNVVP